MGSTFLVNVPDIYLLHLHVAVYSLFHRLYGMYPCHFLTYLRKIYTKEDNQQVFKESILVRISRYDVTSATKPSLEYPCLHFSRCWIGFACIRCSLLQAKTRRSQLRGKTCQTTEVYLDSYDVLACRWRMFDVQDIVIDCAMMSLDLIEGSHSETRCPVAGALKTKAPRKEMTSALQSIGETSMYSLSQC